MDKIIRLGALVGIVLLATATLAVGCGSSHDATGTGGTPGTGGMGGAVDAGPARFPDCVIGGGPDGGPDVRSDICRPSGFPFAVAAFAHSNTCRGVCPGTAPAGTTFRLTQPQAGTLCLSGTNPTDTTALALGYTVFSTDMPSPISEKVWSRFNADVKGITQVKFSIDTPPPAGLIVGADTIHSDLCQMLDCITFGFTLPTPITASGTTTAALADFTITPPQIFDTRSLDGIDFEVPAGAFDFCVHDFQFLDAAGNAVTQ